MFKPNEAIDKRVEKLVRAVGNKTSRRGFLDRLTKAVLIAGAGSIAWLIPVKTGATPDSNPCYDACTYNGAVCLASCTGACTNQQCCGCCYGCVLDCRASCDLVGIPSSCPECCYN